MIAERFPLLRAGVLAAVLGGPALAFAQERIPIDIEPAEESGDAERADDPQTVDILAAPPAPEEPTAAEARECEQQQDASTMTNEIVVCRRLPVDNSDRLAGSREAWLKDYAERSKNYNTIPAPDVDNTHHPFTGSGITIVLTGCFIPPCPGPHPLLIDVEALPPPPEGTDADRVGKGLAPVGNEGEMTEEARQMLEEELGLPPSRYAARNAGGDGVTED